MANRQFFASQMSEMDRPQLINYRNHNHHPHLENDTSRHPRNDGSVSGMNYVAYPTASRPNNYPPVGFSSEVPIHGVANSGILHNSPLHPSSGSSNQFQLNHFLHVPSSYGQPATRDRSSTANVVAENERMQFKRKSPSPSVSDIGHSGGYYCAGTSSNRHMSSDHLQPNPMPMPGPQSRHLNPNSSIPSYQSNNIDGEVFHRNVRSRHSHAPESHPSGAFSSSNLPYNFLSTAHVSRPNMRSHHGRALHLETHPSGAFSSGNLPYNFHPTTHISHPSVAEHRFHSSENSSGLNVAGAHLHTMANLSGSNAAGHHHSIEHISGLNAAGHHHQSMVNNSISDVAGQCFCSSESMAPHSRIPYSGHHHSMEHISGLNVAGHHHQSMVNNSVLDVAGQCICSSECMAPHSRIPYSDSFYYETNQSHIGSSVLNGATDTVYNTSLSQNRNAITLLPMHHCASTYRVEAGLGSINQGATPYTAIPSQPPMGFVAPSLEDVGQSSPQAVTRLTTSRSSRPLLTTGYRPERSGIAGNYYGGFQGFSYDEYSYARWLPETVMMLGPLIFEDYIELFDQHTNMRLDISFEEFLALGESIRNVSTGLSEGSILRCLMETIHCSSVPVKDDQNRTCTICLVRYEPLPHGGRYCFRLFLDDLEEYNEGEKVGRLKCGHDFHASCIRKWLLEKNACPICRAPAV